MYAIEERIQIRVPESMHPNPLVNVKLCNIEKYPFWVGSFASLFGLEDELLNGRSVRIEAWCEGEVFSASLDDHTVVRIRPDNLQSMDTKDTLCYKHQTSNLAGRRGQHTN